MRNGDEVQIDGRADHNLSGPSTAWPVDPTETRFIGEYDPQATTSLGFTLQRLENSFQRRSGPQCYVWLKQSRHQPAPAVPSQEIIDCTLAGVPDGLFVGRPEIMDVQHFACSGGLGQARQQAFSSSQVMLSRLHPPFGFGLSASSPPRSKAICARFTASTTRPWLQQPKAASSRTRAAAPSGGMLTLHGRHFPS